MPLEILKASYRIMLMSDRCKDQILNMTCVAAMGGVVVAMWFKGMLPYFLAIRDQIPVLLAGIALLVLVGLRLLTWEFGSLRKWLSKEAGWSPWRYIVMLLPLLVFFSNLPNARVCAFDFDRIISVQELDHCAQDADLRSFMEGRECRVRGKLALDENENMAMLYHFELGSALGDVKVFSAYLEPTQVVAGVNQHEGVMVTGRVSFRKNTHREYVPVIRLEKANGIRPLWNYYSTWN